MGKFVGIDLGTTYSCVGICREGKIDIVANKQGSLMTPSVVGFSPAGRVVGEPAKNQMAKNPKNTIMHAKRMLGRRFDDPVVQEDMKMWDFTVVGPDKAMVEVDDAGERRTLAPEDISALVLSELKSCAEEKLGGPVDKAVITIPGYFNTAQRQATSAAAEKAGLKVIRLLTEPTAAAIAYGEKKKATHKYDALIFDLGGGTFDVTILSIHNGIYDVKAVAGDTHLGGEDFDNNLLSYALSLIKSKYGKDLSDDERAKIRLRKACEIAKCQLSETMLATIEVERLIDGDDVELEISRTDFETQNENLFRGTLVAVEKVLADAQVGRGSLDEIILVGGSTRIPKVQQLLKEFFYGKEIRSDINPDEAVTYGATIVAAVAEDALHQTMVLREVNPIPIGIQLINDVLLQMIGPNAQYPIDVEKNVHTTADNQTQALIRIFNGVDVKASRNKWMEEFTLDGIPEAPAGVPDIKVKCTLDTSGILTVTATETKNGRTNNIVIVTGNTMRNN